MKIIDFDSIKEMNISPELCYEWVKDVLEMKKECILPAKASMKPGVPGVFYNCMPTLLPALGWGGVKLVNRYPDRAPALDSQILLYDLKTGENVALLDGNWITAMRTGAVAAHSIQLLARRDFSIVGIIGLGNTARATFKVLLALYPDRELTVKLKKHKGQEALFRDTFARYPNLHFEIYDKYEEVVENSDVVISAVTFFGDDICGSECFKKGCLLVPIHTRGFTGCDISFDKIYADDTNHVRGFRYFTRYKFFAEIADVMAETAPGRENAEERILAYNIGIAVHDIYFAGKIFERCTKGQEISLKAPKEKFWIE